MDGLRQVLAAALARDAGAAESRLIGAAASLRFADLAARTGLADARSALEGRCVLIRTRGQMAAAQALVELDGLAARLVLCPPDLAAEHLPAVIERAGAQTVVTDDAALGSPGLPVFTLSAPDKPVAPAAAERASEWLMFTSGTTGVPKLVIHSLAALTGAIAPRAPGAEPVVWGTFYDIRRYGGLQILLRALTGGSSLVLSDAGEPTAAFLARLAAAGVTHQTGTPSHWRWALMNPELALIHPRYVRVRGQ
jgi:non-ribosomal peptide synthetase component F